MQYTGRFGPQGWLGVVIILIGFSLLSGLAFELARVGKAYDYKSWIRMLIGPLWPMFDVLVVLILLLTVAVMSAAAAKLLEETISLETITFR